MFKGMCQAGIINLCKVWWWVDHLDSINFTILFTILGRSPVKIKFRLCPRRQCDNVRGNVSNWNVRICAKRVNGWSPRFNKLYNFVYNFSAASVKNKIQIGPLDTVQTMFEGMCQAGIIQFVQVWWMVDHNISWKKNKRILLIWLTFKFCVHWTDAAYGKCRR